MFGALVFGRLSLNIHMEKIVTVSFAGIMAAGLWMALAPHHSPWSLTLPMGVLSFFFGLCRPPTNNLILEQVNHDAGAASSMLVFTFMMLGSLSMGIVSLPWADKISVLGTMGAIAGGLNLIFWIRCKHFFLTR